MKQVTFKLVKQENFHGLMILFKTEKTNCKKFRFWTKFTVQENWKYSVDEYFLSLPKVRFE